MSGDPDTRRPSLRISGKNLGSLALADVCDRCIWLKLRMQQRMPYSIFPGVFSSIDSFTKNLMHGYIDAHDAPPAWLVGLGDVVGYLPPPHWSTFRMMDLRTGVLLTGAPDGVFVLRDGRLVIVDYKTAKFTPNQDMLRPMYGVQINVYALIAEHIGMGRVAAAALLYTEPETRATRPDDLVRANGVVLPFSTHVEFVELQPERVPPLLARARDLYEMETPPAPREGCRDCALVDQMVGWLAPALASKSVGRGRC